MSQKQLEENISDLLSKSLTGTKPYFISDTATHSDLNGYAIVAIETTKIASIDCNVQGNSLVNETILAGDIYYINITKISLTSGAVFIYRH